MQIVIVGYGLMGNAVEKFCKKNDIPVSGILKNTNDIVKYQSQPNDVLVDFTNGKAFADNIDNLLLKKIPLVVGTTGWDDKFEEIKNKVKLSNIPFCWGKNFSASVYNFYSIVDFATSKLQSLDNVRIHINEIHHSTKKDSPSGTALNLQKIIAKHYNKQVNIVSHRVGSIIGEHSVMYKGDTEDMVLYHKSTSKDCYVKGALLCAKYLLNHNGFYFVEDIFKEIL